MPESSSSRPAFLLRRVTAKSLDVLLAWFLAALSPVGIPLGLLYLVTGDGMAGGSLGKRAFGLRVVEEDGAPCDLRSSLYRNIPFYLLPLCPALKVGGWILFAVGVAPLVLIEFWLVVTDEKGARMGDRVAGTRVEERP